MEYTYKINKIIRMGETVPTATVSKMPGGKKTKMVGLYLDKEGKWRKRITA